MSRHRRLKKISHAEAAESITNLTAMREQLAKDYNLSADDPRVAQACIVRLNQGAWEKQILVGVPVPAVELEAYTNVITALLGPPPTALTVRYVYVCYHCQTESEVDPDTLCAQCKAELLPKLERVPVVPATAEPTAEPVQASAPLPAAAEPAANVVPLAKPAPMRRPDDYAAPYTDITAGCRPALPPLAGNGLAEKVANLNTRPSSPFGVRSGYGRFDNNNA